MVTTSMQKLSTAAQVLREAYKVATGDFFTPVRRHPCFSSHLQEIAWVEVASGTIIYNPNITPIYYSSFHFLFHYPYITPI